MSKADATLAQQIERLEAQANHLREAIQRSGRLVKAGRASCFAGGALLICLILGLATFTPVRMLVGITLMLGGLVLMGSSVATTRQLELSLKDTEEKRNAAIDALELVQIGDGAGDFTSFRMLGS
jgi:Flp pilus assembly protein TadB